MRRRLPGARGAAAAPAEGSLERGRLSVHQDLFFVIPTYRLRDVGETVEQYDEHSGATAIPCG